MCILNANSGRSKQEIFIGTRPEIRQWLAQEEDEEGLSSGRSGGRGRKGRGEVA